MAFPYVFRSGVVLKTHILRSNLLVETWLSRNPSVHELRPESCAGCGRLHGHDGYVLRGHGTRERTLWGPLRSGDDPAVTRIPSRRYLCPPCQHLTVVVPLEASGVFRYAVTAIVVAFALWAIEGQPAGEVHRRISPHSQCGFGEPRLWPSLHRWVRQRDRLWPALAVRPGATDRETAGAIVAKLASRLARAPPSPSVADAWEAALMR